MKIELTNTIDRNIISDDISFKLMLADGILSLFTPLFYEEIRKKHGQFKRNVLDIKQLKQNIIDSKLKIRKLNFLINKEKIRNEVLNEINYLSDADVIYGSNRQAIKDILLTLDTQTPNDLKKSFEILRGIIKTKIKNK